MPGEYPPREPGGSRLRRTAARDDRMGQSRSGASRWQAPQPPGAPARPGASGAHRRPPFPPDRSTTSDVYRPYNPAARAAGPRGLPDASARWSADPFGVSAPGMMTSAHIEAIHRKRNGFALFHDGNAGHLWRGEIMSMLGESALSVGVIIWLAYLTASPFAVLMAVLALGIPWLLVGPLGATFENVSEPGRLLTWIGRVRVAAALGIVAMHFLTIYPLLYLLLFAIGIGGRLRQSLRVAAMRVCLAPGEIELVTNDMYVGASVAAVLGPLLGSLLFLALGDRIILVGLGAALLFLLAGNSDGFLDALPEQQRGFLQATPAGVAPDEATRDDLLRAARGASATEGDEEAEDDNEDAEPLSQEQRELALPEWYQQGPRNMAQAMADIRVGMGLAGGRNTSATALLALLALALAGGGLSVLEVFYLGDRLNLPPLDLGALVSLEGAGLALGALLVSMPPLSKVGPRLTLIGLALTGAALAIMGATPVAAIAFPAALGMGAANALAVTGARQALRAGRDGAERRAISAAESFLSALVSLLGALLFTAGYAGVSRIHVGAHTFSSAPLGLLFTITGIGLALIALRLMVAPGLRDKRSHKDAAPAIHATNARMTGMAAAVDGSATGAVGALWDDDDDDDDRGYTGEYDADYDEDDDWDDEPPTRGNPRRPAGRPPQPRDRRNRW